MPRQDLYGSGFAYPFGFDSATGGVKQAEAVDSVRASLYRLFETAPGESFMEPAYGCALKSLVYEQDTLVLRALAQTAVRQAVARWEPRIAEVLQVDVDADPKDPNHLQLRVYFRLIESQTVENMVYPFMRSGPTT